MGALIQMNQQDPIRQQRSGKLGGTVGTTRTCANCSTEFEPDGVFSRQCPRCLFDLGVGPDVESALTVQSGSTVSHYRLLEKIGEGGMGVVWRAEDTTLNRVVAIKFLPANASFDETRRSLFLDEAKLAASVADARIVQVHELGTEDDLDFIVMEYVEGKPLNQVLDGRPFPAHKVADLGHQIAHALSKAHRKGLLHRDLKPANVLVTADGELKVVDFGLATLFDRDDAAPDSQITKSIVAGELREDRKLVGTLAYMSPEQTRMEKLDARSDVFSLGTVLYEMTTGQLPFGGSTNSEVLRSVEKARPTPVREQQPQVPLELGRIIQKCMAPRRGDRYQSMEDLAVDLKRLGRDLDSGSSPSYEDVSGELAPVPRRRVGLVAAGVVVLLAIAAVAWQWFGPSALLDERTVLILPLEVRGQTDGGGYAGRAFAEGIATHLARARELKVLPIAEAYESNTETILERARRAGAGRVLTGALIRNGDVVQARLSLMDVNQGRILWGTEQEEPDGDLPALTSSLAKEVVAELGATLPKLYDYPTNLTGGPEMGLSPILGHTIGSLRRGGGRAGALEPSRRLVESFPDELDAHVIRIFALYTNWETTPEPRAAIEAILPFLERIDPGNPYGPFFRAQLLRDNGRNEAAAELFTELLGRDDLTPDLRAYALRMRGLARKEEADVEGSLADMEAALRLDPTRSWTYQYLSGSLLRAGRPDDAVTAAHQAVALEPDSARTIMNLGEILRSIGRWEESLVPHRRACELSLDRKQLACALYAIALFRAGHEVESVVVAEEAAEMSANAAGQYNLAAYRALSGDRDAALRHLRRASEFDFDVEDFWPQTDPTLASLWGDPEFEKLLAGFWQETVDELRETVAGRPDSWEVLHDLGDALSGLGSWNEAITIYAKSCALTTTQDPCAHHAYALHRVGQEEQAREVARVASERKDEDWSTYHLACYYALAGDRAEALDHLKRSFALGYWGGEVLDDPDLASLRGDPEFEALMETRTGRRRVASADQ